MLWAWVTSNKYIVCIAGAVFLIAIAFNSGADWQRNKCNARFAAQREALIQQLQTEQTRANQAAQQYETEKSKRTQAAQIITKEVTRVIQKPIYQSCRIDADGMHLLEAAIYQANRASQPDDKLPYSLTSP